MEQQDENLFRIVEILEEREEDTLIEHLAYEIGSARIRSVVSKHNIENSSRLKELMTALPKQREAEPLTYYDMQSVGELAEALGISTSYVSNMANNRNANRMHIEREIHHVSNNRTFYHYRVEPGFDVGAHKNNAMFEADMPRFIRRSIIRFAEEGLGITKDVASFTSDEFKERFSKDKKPSLYEPYKKKLAAMIRAEEFEYFGADEPIIMSLELVGTQEGCDIPEEHQSQLWIELNRD